MSDYLAADQLDAVRDAAINQFADQATMRPLLFQYVHRDYVAILPVIPAPAFQITSDLMRMNGVERLVDGSVPLETWLHNAVRLSLEPGPRAVLEKALDTVATSASGEPEMGPAGDVSEVKEEIIFRDDTLAIGFLAAGAAASGSVGRILIQPYENGALKQTPHGASEYPHAGTCWLIADDLVVTNHHVVNARSAIDGPAPQATLADLRKQAGSAVVHFDYDTELSTGPETSAAELVAWSAELDYAVLRLASPFGRIPLPLLRIPLRAGIADNVAVNVIQHPSGLAKRIALRNNIVQETTDKDVRYFTDTRAGSSGSPVLTDRWAVCALHRGSRRVDVRFQGKTSAYVNVGTQITAMLADLKQRFPHVYGALPTQSRRSHG